jgi:hypothetical protein
VSEVDRADLAVVGVGEVEVAVGADLEVARRAELGVERRAIVAGVALLAVAGEAVDHPVDPRSITRITLLLGVGDVELAVVVDDAAARVGVRPDGPTRTGPSSAGPPSPL